MRSTLLRQATERAWGGHLAVPPRGVSKGSSFRTCGYLALPPPCSLQQLPGPCPGFPAPSPLRLVGLAQDHVAEGRGRGCLSESRFQEQSGLRLWRERLSHLCTTCGSRGRL